MPGATAKGVPYSQGGDAASTIDTSMQGLAEWVDARPGVSALSTAQRNALAGADLWQDRVILNTDTGQFERLTNLVGPVWSQIGSPPNGISHVLAAQVFS